MDGIKSMPNPVGHLCKTAVSGLDVRNAGKGYREEVRVRDVNVRTTGEERMS